MSFEFIPDYLWVNTDEYKEIIKWWEEQEANEESEEKKA